MRNPSCASPARSPASAPPLSPKSGMTASAWASWWNTVSETHRERIRTCSPPSPSAAANLIPFAGTQPRARPCARNWRTGRMRRLPSGSPELRSVYGLIGNGSRAGDFVVDGAQRIGILVHLLDHLEQALRQLRIVRPLDGAHDLDRSRFMIVRHLLESLAQALLGPFHRHVASPRLHIRTRQERRARLRAPELEQVQPAVAP